MGLLAKKKEAAQTQGASAVSNNFVGGIAGKVIFVDEDTSTIKIEVLQSASDKAPIGKELTVGIIEKNRDRVIKQVFDAEGDSPGSVLLIENCYANEDGGVNASWINTAQAASKLTRGSKKAQASQASRTVDMVHMGVPTLSFRNPNPTSEEPKRIYWPITAKTRRFKGKEFDLNWMLSKLTTADKEGIKQMVSVLSPNPEMSMRVDSVKAAVDQVISSLEDNDRVILRISSGDVEDLTYQIIQPRYTNAGDNSVKDLDALRKDLENSLFYSISNADVQEVLDADGEYALEVIPARDMAVVGKTLQGLLGDIKEQRIFDKDGNVAMSYAAIYGTEPDTISTNIATLAPLDGGDVAIYGRPVSATRQRYSLGTIPSAHFDQEAHQKLSVKPAEADDESAATEESFNGDDFQLAKDELPPAPKSGKPNF